MTNALRVNASDLLRRPGSEKVFDLTVALSELEIDDPERFADGAQVDVHLRLESLTDGIVVDGRLLVPWHGICRRCLAETGGVLECEVNELYQRTLTDPEAFELEGDQLDLRPVVRELVLLDTPSTPLCRPDCAGLCATCGINRNDALCACEQLLADPRWEGLSGLRDRLPPD
ncbi:MAG: DUF177 domain-containing protein [Actinomycetota bacterium]